VDELVVWTKLPVVHFPRVAVRSYHPSGLTAVGIEVAELAVARSIRRATPDPAFAADIDHFPEAH
jgi:hypothetical protein